MRRWLIYAAMTGGGIAVILLVLWLGPDANGRGVPRSSPVPANRLVHVLVALAVVILLARLVGLVFRKLGQPPVIGEIASGLLLGPSVFGQLAPAASAWLLPADVAPFLRIIAEVGVIIYMFLVGVELDTRHLREKTASAIAVSHASIVLPFVLGSLLALWLFPRWAPPGISFGGFALFIGVSMSVTAFPVLARILTDRGLQKTQIGTIALGCAAVDDITAWCLLALLVSVVRAEPGTVVLTVSLAIAFVAVVLLVMPRITDRLARRCEERGTLDHSTFTVMCVAVLLAAVATEAIGIHALFGAFLIGVTTPHESRLATELRNRLNDAVVVLLLPAFFAYTGMRTQVGLLAGGLDWLACGLIIAVAATGKLGGSALAARVSGMPWRQSFALGVLMNTRGLMELVVLNIGLDLGVISPTLFTMFVIMALVTTMATTPIVDALVREAR